MGYHVRECQRGGYRRLTGYSAGGVSSADRGGAPADPLAAGEAIDEMLAANDSPQPDKKRKYPEPDLALECSGRVGGKGSYHTSASN